MSQDEMEDTIVGEVPTTAKGARAGSFAAGLAMGALLGAAVALLFAPARGDVTREKLRRRLDDARDYASGEFDDLRKRARKELRRRIG